MTQLQFEALLCAARASANRADFALIAMLGLLGLRIFEATGTDIADLGEEHGHRVLRVVGKGIRVVLVPLPPAVGRAVDRAVDGGASGPLLLNTRGRRMDRHAATRRLGQLADQAGVRLPRMHPHMLGHTWTTDALSWCGLCATVPRSGRGARLTWRSVRAKACGTFPLDARRRGRYRRCGRSRRPARRARGDAEGRVWGSRDRGQRTD